LDFSFSRETTAIEQMEIVQTWFGNVPMVKTTPIRAFTTETDKG